jgi:hypothetical protein
MANSVAQLAASKYGWMAKGIDLPGISVYVYFQRAQHGPGGVACAGVESDSGLASPAPQ